MATFETSHYAASKPDRTNSSRLAPANVASGQVEFAVIPYTLAGSEAANDIINLGILPEDVIPVPQLSRVVCSADPGTTLTLDIGTADNTDGWADGIVLSSGGVVECASATMPAWLAATALVPDSGKGDAVVYATVASANTLTAAVVLYFVLAYKRGR
jgi:hypothetical protein